jgi:hypothetical protein
MVQLFCIRTAPHRQDFVQAEDKVPADDIVECRDEVQPQSGEVVWCGAPHHTALRTWTRTPALRMHPLFHFVDGRRDADICFAEEKRMSFFVKKRQWLTKKGI